MSPTPKHNKNNSSSLAIVISMLVIVIRDCFIARQPLACLALAKQPPTKAKVGCTDML